jgi:hypothetical protein
MIKIKFHNEFPTDETVKTWAEKWTCFQYPDVVVYKKEDEKILFVDNSAVDQNGFFSSIFPELVKLEMVWVSGNVVHDEQSFMCYDSDNETFKSDYSLFLKWGEDYKKILLSKYRILKSLSAPIDYIRFSLLEMPLTKVEKIIDKTWNPTSKELELYDSFDDSNF